MPTLSEQKLISQYRARFFAASRGKQALLELILDNEVAEQVYNSNAIENSTLSLEDTEKILSAIDLDRFISQRELFEATNLARVVKYIDKKALTSELSVETLLLLHKMLISNIRDEVAGRFRNAKEWVRVGNHIAPNPILVETLIDDMLTTYFSKKHDSIIKRIAIFHLTFEHIHPFVDGNGRIGRVLINYLLIREGYVPINIKFNDRRLYYEAFNEFDSTGRSKIMEEIVSKALRNSYHKRLAYLENKEIVTLPEYAKITKQSHSALLNKASRQTIEAFTERGKWKIGK
jgi:Fic family protein